MSIIDGTRVNAAITNAALVSRLDAQTVAGSKTFTDKMIVSDTTQSTSKDVGSIVTEGGLGVEKNINAGGDITAVGAVSGSNLSGANTGDITLSPIGATPNANGASLSGQSVTLQPASSSFGGVISTIAQSFAGIKTFATDIVANTLVQFNGSTSGFVKVQAPATPTSYTLTLPPTAGTTNYVLKTDGSGNTDWVAQASAGANATLSNLTSPTAINQDLIFSPSGATIPNLQTVDKLVAGTTASLNIKTGSPIIDSNSGDLQLMTGNVDGTGVAGTISIIPGSNLNNGTRGNVSINANQTSLQSNNLVVNSGFGIDFSATANGSGTTASELLNDYERGTFTATLTAGTSGTITLSPTGNTLAYTKIGNQNTITGQVTVQSVSAPTGALRLNGLPFSSGAGTQASNRSAAAIYGAGLNAASITALVGFIAPSSTNVLIDRYVTGSTADMAANIQAGSIIIISLTYFTA